MVPLQLVFRPSILGSNIEAFEMRRVSHTECDSNKTAPLRRGVCRSIAYQGQFNRAVLERCSPYHRQTSRIPDIAGCSVRDAHSRNSAIGHEVSLHIM